MESTASPVAEPITFRNLEISTTVARLLADRREHSREALEAFHRTQEAAFRELQVSIAAQGHSDDQVLDLVKDLTTAALDHVSALSNAVHAEADVRIQTAAEETLKFKRENEELSERLAKTLVEMKDLRAELDLERRQVVTIISDLHQARRATAAADASRAEAVAAHQSEMSQRLSLESELVALRQKLRAVAAVATELVAVSDSLDIAGSGPDRIRPDAIAQRREPSPVAAASS